MKQKEKKPEKMDELVNFNTTKSMVEALRQGTFYKKFAKRSDFIRYVIASHPDVKRFMNE